MSEASKPIFLDNCAFCGNKFLKRRKNHIYCSEKCQKKACYKKYQYKPLEPRVCAYANCQKTFMPKTHVQKFCSYECRKESEKKDYGFGNCVVCGERFKKKSSRHVRCLECRKELKVFKKQPFPRFCVRCRFQTNNAEFCDKCKALAIALKKPSNRFALENGSCLVFFGYFWIAQPYELAMKNKAKGKDICCNPNEFEQFKESVLKKTQINGFALISIRETEEKREVYEPLLERLHNGNLGSGNKFSTAFLLSFRRYEP